MVYLHYAEMNTWLVQVTNGQPLLTVDREFESVSDFLRDMLQGHKPAHVSIIVSRACEDGLGFLRRRLNEPSTKRRLMGCRIDYRFGERF